MRLLLILAMVFAVQKPADACQCARSLPQSAALAKQVFAGTITSATKVGNTITYVIAVDAVWKGKVAATMAVTGSLDDCMHPVAFAKGARVVFVGTKIEVCDGTQVVTAETVAALDKQLGKSKKP